jgi:3-deoxy-D-manno-octulosonic-acid transferase
VGELGSWWGRADIGFVGGSMGTRGGQNVIEPAAYGVAVCFGPNTHNFRDVVQLLLERQAAVVVRDGQELTDFVQACLEGQPRVQPLGARARQLVAEHLGATERTVGLIERLILQPLPAGAGTQWRRHDAESLERPTTIPSDAVVPQGRVRL